ncbi:MAG: hypothetical protein H6638_02920 [Ardenticatenales bacterium]|nr:hypothetical protein [Ardenticatenales bacterium]
MPYHPSYIVTDEAPQGNPNDNSRPLYLYLPTQLVNSAASRYSNKRPILNFLT